MKEIKGLQSIIKSFGTKQVKFGGYAALITIAVIVGLIMINVIIGQFTIQVDMTENKIFSLSDQTVQVLKQVDSPVTVYGLWQPGEKQDHISNVTEVLNLYIAQNKNIKFEIIDPEKNPTRLQQYDRDKQGLGWGCVIVEGAKGYRVIRPEDMYDFGNMRGQNTITGNAVERRLTSALQYAGTGEVPMLYETTGHREVPLANLGLQDFLMQENYVLNQLNLIQSDIPDNATAILIISPLNDFSRPETDKILDYLDRGGRLFIMVDFRLQEMTVLNEALASYGINFDYGIVIESNSRRTWSGNSDVIMPEIKEHPITSPIIQTNGTVITPYSMGIATVENVRRGIGITPLLVSSSSSWLRSDMNDQTSNKTASDKSGPITTAVAVVDPVYMMEDGKQSRIIAIGITPFVYHPLFGELSIFFQQMVPGNNIDLFMNSLTWLNDNPDTITIRSKSTFVLPMQMNGFQVLLFGGLIVIVIPLAFFIMGLVTWLRRRHL